jgi:hypothetical protein
MKGLLFLVISGAFWFGISYLWMTLAFSGPEMKGQVSKGDFIVCLWVSTIMLTSCGSVVWIVFRG